MLKPFLATAGALLLAAPAFAGDCDGRPGWVLDVPDQVAIGSDVSICMHGPATEMGLLMISTSTGSIDTPYGHICVSFPFLTSFLFTLDANGDFCVTGTAPCDPALIDFTLYMQFITCRPNKGVSNLDSITFTDALCDGNLCTFTQGGWGNTCHGSNPGCRRDQNFASAFPNGVTLGDQDGIDGDGDFAAVFTSAKAVEDFLPAGGTPGPLSGDAKDPTSTGAGVFAGQLLAAKLNVGFDDAGALDDCKTRKDVKLGDLVFIAGAVKPLQGWRVRDVIGLADLAIAGAFGTNLIDVTGDGVGDVSIADISDALDKLNNDFDNGAQNLGYLGLP